MKTPLPITPLPGSPFPPQFPLPSPPMSPPLSCALSPLLCPSPMPTPLPCVLSSPLHPYTLHLQLYLASLCHAQLRQQTLKLSYKQKGAALTALCVHQLLLPDPDPRNALRVQLSHVGYSVPLTHVSEAVSFVLC